MISKKDFVYLSRSVVSKSTGWNLFRRAFRPTTDELTTESKRQQETSFTYKHVRSVASLISARSLIKYYFIENAQRVSLYENVRT